MPSGHAVCLFSPKAEKLRLRSRIADLLDLPAISEDGFSEHIREKCKRKLERLEKAVEELAKFRRQAKSVLRWGYLKRTKETSCFDGVSPDTAKSRPPYRNHVDSRNLTKVTTVTVNTNAQCKIDYSFVHSSAAVTIS